MYTSYKLNAINNVFTSTGILTFHVIGIFQWTNMPVTLHMYIPLYLLCNLHVEHTLLHIEVKKAWQTLIYHAITIYLPVINRPPKCHRYATCQFFIHVQISDNYVSIYTSHEFTTINNVNRSTGIHTFHITGICPWTNMPATLYIYVPLHFKCSLKYRPHITAYIH